MKGLFEPKDYTLTEDEFNAVYQWIDENKDSLEEPLKQGLLKLISSEQQKYRQGRSSK
ncbi:MAG TPA: hypothetical protein VJ869_14490 [Sphaerochaeta sp.]|nr:hypothetical protein [Sphaerochaeta sp.]